MVLAITFDFVLLSRENDLCGLRSTRAPSQESLYEFGSRAGFWRLHGLLTSRALPVTVFAVGMALERNPEAAAAMQAAGWEV